MKAWNISRLGNARTSSLLARVSGQWRLCPNEFAYHTHQRTHATRASRQGGCGGVSRRHQCCGPNQRALSAATKARGRGRDRVTSSPIPLRCNMKKVKAKKASVPCQYGCGRSAEGSLSINYYPNDPDSVEAINTHNWFSVTVPCCRACLQATIRLSVSIPDVRPDAQSRGRATK